MSPSSFFLIAGILFFAFLFFLLHAKAAPKPPPPMKEPPPRWSLYILHLGRLRSGKGPAIEQAGAGLKLSPSGTVPRDFSSLALVDDKGGPGFSIERRRRFGKEALRIRLGREGFAVMRSSSRGSVLPQVIVRKGEPLALAEAGDAVEIRRGAKLLAQASPAIAGLPDAVGVEILAAEEPTSVLAVVTALWLLRLPELAKSREGPS